MSLTELVPTSEHWLPFWRSFRRRLPARPPSRPSWRRRRRARHRRRRTTSHFRRKPPRFRETSLPREVDVDRCSVTKRRRSRKLPGMPQRWPDQGRANVPENVPTESRLFGNSTMNHRKTGFSPKKLSFHQKLDFPVFSWSVSLPPTFTFFFEIRTKLFFYLATRNEKFFGSCFFLVARAFCWRDAIGEEKSKLLLSGLQLHHDDDDDDADDDDDDDENCVHSLDVKAAYKRISPALNDFFLTPRQGGQFCKLENDPGLWRNLIAYPVWYR